ERVLDGRDQIFQLNRFAFAEVEDVEQRPAIFQRAHRSLDDVVDVSVIAARGAVTELIDRLASMNFFCELMNRQVGPLARPVDGEVAQSDNTHLIKMRKS